MCASDTIDGMHTIRNTTHETHMWGQAHILTCANMCPTQISVFKEGFLMLRESRRGKYINSQFHKATEDVSGINCGVGARERFAKIY